MQIKKMTVEDKTTQHLVTRRHQGEWEPQSATWLSWPHNINEWGEYRLPKIKQFYYELISTILNFQDVKLIIDNYELEKEVDEYFKNDSFKHTLHKIIIPNNDIWIRDYGPFFLERKNVTRNEIASVATFPRNDMLILDFKFNAWGGKFPPWDKDDNIPKEIAKKFNLEIETNEIVLEGGAIDFSGDGLILTTEECLLNKNRNNLTKENIENTLKKSFEIEEVIWLKNGLSGDHTDGHIDNIARFIDTRKVLIGRTYELKDELALNANILNNWIHPTKNYSLEVIEIPLPDRKVFGTKTLPCSYVNFIFVNGGVIVPIFNSSSDEMALNIFTLLFPDRTVIGIDCTLLIEEGGALHCITKQEPLL